MTTPKRRDVLATVLQLNTRRRPDDYRIELIDRSGK